MTCVEIGSTGLVKSLPSTAFTEHSEHNKREKKTYANPILDSKYSSAAISLRRHWPGNDTEGGGTFLCHIPSLVGAVSLEDSRLASRTQGEAGELEMICLVTGGLYACVDRWSETSNF